MKASDLRIGNTTFEYVKDEGIYIESNITCWDFERARLNNDEQCFEWRKPIPITEEWLLKLGFTYENNRFINKFPLQLISSPNGFDYFFAQSFGGKFITIGYIHQLQNLYFALTGEELKLKDHE